MLHRKANKYQRAWDSYADSAKLGTVRGNGRDAHFQPPSTMSDLFAQEEVPVTEGQFVCLTSGDGHQFYVSRKCAISSNTIKEMLSGPGAIACIRR